MLETNINQKKKIESKPSCTHCGDICKDSTILLGESIFCCQGCQMVYTILSENGLENFYRLNEKAGISQKAIRKQKYDFLDDELTISRLIDFKDDNIMKIAFYIPAIHCSSCLWLLENLQRINNNVLSVRVDFLQKSVAIGFNYNELTLKSLVELLASIGYPPHIILNDLEKKHQKPELDKSLYYKLGLAGFAFGNIMLFSFPEYLGLSSDHDQGLTRVFSYLNLALIIPVLAYSGKDYFHSAWQGLKQKHLNIDVPVSLGILALFLRSVYEILTHIGPGYLDSLSGLIFFLLIGKWFQQKTFAQISFDRDFKSYFPIACTVLKEESELQLTLDKLQVGDIVMIRHGELVPADAVLIEGEAKMDYSFVTGESTLSDKHQNDLIYAGGRQMGGIICLRIIKTVSNSYLTQLWNDQAFKKENQNGRTSIIADRIAKLFTIIILLVSFASLFYWLPKDIPTAINAFTAVLIIACPCAVALSIPFTFGNVLRILAMKGIYLRNTDVIERISNIKHIVFDKTGTITNIRSSQLIYSGYSLTTKEEQLIYSLSRHSTHPLSRQIEKKYKHFQALDISEFIEEKGKGISGFIDGHLVRIGSQEFIGDVGDEDSLSNKGINIEVDGKLKGFYLQKNAYRKGLNSLIKNLSKKYRLSLITGDNNQEHETLKSYFVNTTEILFDQKPMDKLSYIRNLQAENINVAMIGDGLNDSGALKQSNVGIVISENTSNFTPSCDVIMDARQFSKLMNLMDYSKDSVRIVISAYFIALLYNIVGLSFAVQGLLSPVIAAILMPLSSVTIVLIGITASTYMAKKHHFL